MTRYLSTFRSTFSGFRLLKNITASPWPTENVPIQVEVWKIHKKKRAQMVLYTISYIHKCRTLVFRANLHIKSDLRLSPSESLLLAGRIRIRVFNIWIFSTLNCARTHIRASGFVQISRGQIRATVTMNISFRRQMDQYPCETVPTNTSGWTKTLRLKQPVFKLWIIFEK